MTAHLPPATGATPPSPDGNLPDQPNPEAQTVPLHQAPPPPMMPPPGPPPGYAPEAASGSSPATPVASAFAAPPGSPYPSPDTSPVPVAGRNGLAIAALCCGGAGVVPVAAVVGIVLGAVALGRLRHRVQRGKGMAVAGIVLGVLWLGGWVALINSAANDVPARNTSGTVTETSDAYVEDLKAGDCFSGAGRDEVDSLTIVPCTSAHESQVVTIFTMPSGPWPGKDKVIAAAEKGCTEKADPLVTDQAYDNLRPSFIYPQDAFSWRGGRQIICLVDAPKGTTTGTALK